MKEYCALCGRPMQALEHGAYYDGMQKICKRCDFVVNAGEPDQDTRRIALESTSASLLVALVLGLLWLLFCMWGG